MKIQYAMITETGNRSKNEDAVRIEEKNGRYLFVLADGLGSYGNGMVASETAVRASVESFIGNDDADSIPESAVWAAQRAVLERQKNDTALSSMSSTLAVLYLSEEKARWAHIGDSRIYCFREKKLAEYTNDHSVPQLLVRLGQIRQDEVRGHPDQNRLLKVIGREWTDNPFSISPVYTLNGTENFLICSDGFWEYIDESQMEQSLSRAGTPEQWLRLMEEITIHQSSGISRDNYSAICISVTK